MSLMHAKVLSPLVAGGLLYLMLLRFTTISFFPTGFPLSTNLLLLLFLGLIAVYALFESVTRVP